MGTYQLEAELQRTIEQKIPRLRPPEGSLYYRREVPVAGRVPDFVFVTVRNAPLDAVIPRDCTYRHAAVLAVLRRRNRARLSYLADHLYTSTSSVQALLTDLVRSGAVVKNATGSFSLSAEWREMETEVVAVEAKLSRWKEALRQAVAYQEYADWVVVVMDPEAVRRGEDVVDSFREAGVGLCSVSPSKTTWLVFPVKERKSGHNREYLLTSALSRSQTAWSRL